MTEFNSKAHVQAWVDETDNGVEELRWAIDTGRFNGQKMLLSRAWLAEHDRNERERMEEEMRAVAKRSADAAWWSARAAFLAVFAAVASLFVAAWPFIKP